MISDKEVAHYRQNGYLVVPDVLDADLLARLRGALDDLVANASSVSSHTDIYDLEPGHTPAAPKVRRIKLPHTHTPVFWELANYRPMVAIILCRRAVCGARATRVRAGRRSNSRGMRPILSTTLSVVIRVTTL